MSAEDTPEQPVTPGERVLGWIRGHAPRSRAGQIGAGIVGIAAVVRL